MIELIWKQGVGNDGRPTPLRHVPGRVSSNGITLSRCGSARVTDLEITATEDCKACDRFARRDAERSSRT